jgi:hypothetical protein
MIQPQEQEIQELRNKQALSTSITEHELIEQEIQELIWQEEGQYAESY